MENKTIIAVDLGNSVVKIGFFINNELQVVERLLWEEMEENSERIKKWKNFSGICSSVLSTTQNEQFQKLFPNVQMLDLFTKLPFEVDYQTPTTLGKDRLCNIAAAFYTHKNTHALTIDVGTCIKYDFLENGTTYKGGAISPGVRLRYKSLNDYTANLPLLSEMGPAQLIGNSTTNAIHSGVINGVKAEIVQLIQEYEKKYESLTIFVTGGDANYFDLESKNNIFANRNLTLEGLFHIYLFNVQ